MAIRRLWIRNYWHFYLSFKSVIISRPRRFCSWSTMSKLQFIDVGANLNDEMYKGEYNGSKKHEPDLDKVLERAWNIGLDRIISTAGNLGDVQASLDIVNKDDRLFTTVGVHPTRCNEFLEHPEGADSYMDKLKSLLQENDDKIIAIGEFGLDYDRTKFCDMDTQKRFFERQLKELARNSSRPLFLHCRAAADDLHSILSQNKDCFSQGVVHSFDGTVEEMHKFLDLNLYIGINGWLLDDHRICFMVPSSLKTEENLNVLKEIPTDKLLLETDAPWCGIRPSHAGSQYVKTKFEAAKKNWSDSMMFKQRNEPQTIVNILEVVAGVKNMEPDVLAATVYENTLSLFFGNRK